MCLNITRYPGTFFSEEYAGVQHRRNFNEEGAVENLDQEIVINFTAPIHLIAEILPCLRQQPQAVIVNVSSGLAFAPMADVPVYGATKAAMHSFTLSLRHQLKTTGVRVMEMVPPILDTGLGGGVRDGSKLTAAFRHLETELTNYLAQKKAA